MLMLIFIVAMGGLGVRANRSFKELVRLRIRTNELAKDLRKQKELAEQASLAKSSFLAAASHDLRQPVHALGMFVGALRGVALPLDAVRLVERIEESTNAMDSLFSAILDISRLDAGVVDVQPRAFAIQPLLDRICGDHAAEADQKSIGLACHACSATVHTDPLLMERVLRNLLSNAVRYTLSGRVVVGCRQTQWQNPRGNLGYRPRHPLGRKRANISGILPAAKSGTKSRDGTRAGPRHRPSAE